MPSGCGTTRTNSQRGLDIVLFIWIAVIVVRVYQIATPYKPLPASSLKRHGSANNHSHAFDILHRLSRETSVASKVSLPRRLAGLFSSQWCDVRTWVVQADLGCAIARTH